MKLRAKCAFTASVDGIDYEKAEGDEFEVDGKSALVLVKIGVAEKAAKKAAKKKGDEDER